MHEKSIKYKLWPALLITAGNAGPVRAGANSFGFWNTWQVLQSIYTTVRNK